MSMRMYGYARISAVEQELGGFGLAIQKSAIEKYCAENSYELVFIYEDAGISGVIKDDENDLSKRPGLIKMFEDLKSVKDNIDGLVVFDIDRIGRNTDSMAYVRRKLRKCDVEIYSIHQPEYKVLNMISGKKFDQFLSDFLSEWKHDELVNRLEVGRAKAKAEREELATLQRFKPSRHSNKNPYLFL